MRLTWLAALLLLTAGCGTQADGAQTSTGAGPGAGAWSRLPDPPLSAREGSVAAFVGGRAVFVGGYDGPPCPAGADCAYREDANRSDGAAYDPATASWSRIADAPLGVPPESPATVVGDRLYVLVGDTLLAWDSDRDAWTRTRPPGDPGWSRPVSDGTRLVLAEDSQERGVHPDQVLDTTTGRWSALPPDPLRPAFDRLLVPTPAGLVLTAKPLDDDGHPADPAFVHAALLPEGSDHWQVLPPSEQLGGWRWSWTGERLVDPTLGGADGGEVNNFGRVLAYGGRLDPATATWSPLPHAPAEGSGDWGVEALDGPRMAVEGWLYDDAAGDWTRLARPDDAPAAPGPAVWAGDTLVVSGGTDGSRGTSPEDVRSTGAWALPTD